MSETLVQYLKERPSLLYAEYRRKSENSQKCGRLTDTSFALRMSIFVGILSVPSGTRESLALQAGCCCMCCYTVIHGLAYKLHGTVLCLKVCGCVCKCMYMYI